MVSAGDFRNGITFEEDGNVFQIVEFQHVKPGKGAAFVRTKIRNVISGSVVERTYNPTAKFPTAYIERREMTYSYQDGDLYYFMDNETFEQIPLNESELGDAFKFVKENEVCKVLSYKGKVFGVEAPNFVVLEVTKTDPGFKGQHGHQHAQARHAGDRRGDPCAPVHQRGRYDPHRHPHRRVYGARITFAKTGKAARYGLACLILKTASGPERGGCRLKTLFIALR